MSKQVVIKTMYAFIQLDPVDNAEGLIAFKDARTGWWMPMVGADMERVEQLRPLAQETATHTGNQVQLVHFTNREEKEVIEP